MLEQLMQIHNQLISVRVSGDDTIKMADVLIGLRQLISLEQQRSAEEVKEV